MNTKSQPVIDISLTPQSASAKGYKHVHDIPDLLQTLNELLLLAEARGYKIGVANSKTSKRLGLYRKIEEK